MSSPPSSGRDDRQHLGHHDGPHGTLGDAAADQHARPGGGAAECGHDREAGHPDQEEPLTAERVAQPAAGDQHQRVGQRVSGQGPLHVRVGGVQVALDRRDGDIDDGYIEQVHEPGQQQDDQGEPAARVGLAGRRRWCQDLCI
jgi:hypothetical protein